MIDDQIAVEPVSEQRCQATVALGCLEGIEAAIGQARNTWLEIEPEQMHDREHNIGDSPAIDVQRRKIGAAFMTEHAIEGMDRFTSGSRDQ